jgi:hypothetical protein
MIEVNDISKERISGSDESSGILAEANLVFEENLIYELNGESSCTCIRHEKCCGCLLQ